jgi:hypothetical protein
MNTPSPADLIALLQTRLDRQPFAYDPARPGINLNLIGLRALPGIPDRFDDLLCALWQQADGEWQSRYFAATTDPGGYHLHNPGRVNGTAIMVHDRWYPAMWRIGKHKGEYFALCQNPSRPPPPVWRDADRDSSARYGGVEHTDAGGINLHHAGVASTVVDRWSAGCQVVAGRPAWDALWDLILKSAAVYGPTFSYALIGVEV